MQETKADRKSRSLRRNMMRAGIWATVAAVLVVGGIWGYRALDSSRMDFDVAFTPSTIPADNSSSAILEIRLISRFGNRLNVHALPYAPRVEIVEGSGLITLVPQDDSLTYRARAGIQTGTVVVRVRIYGAPGPIEARLNLMPSLADRNHNGYPDAMDLTAESDRNAFRRWFTTIAVAQAHHIDDRWHDRDCAGLLRYCYREALKRHDNTWLRSREWLVTSAIPDVRKYNYPAIPLVGTHVFNAGIREPQDGAAGQHEGTERSSAVQREPGREDGPSYEEGRPVAMAVGNRPSASRSPLDQFQEYAEAARLKDNSLCFLSRNAGDALPGDVIFYLNDTESEWPYHSMIYLGDGNTIYHTGPDGNKPGIVKRLTLAQLASHPNPRWHPVASNPYFLGFYRWRILM
ncbi:MAG TPA: DUF1175 family protein [Candidatus Kapabacteria bacterium]|nr:DUF1175 family protein [Candidatus Kapabacteria bacterium]